MLLIITLLTVSCFAQKSPAFSTADYVRALKNATDVMVNDVTTPASAARYYAYINLAANETLALFDEGQPSFVGVLNQLNVIKVDSSLLQRSDPSLAPILAVYKTGMRLLPSGYILQKNLDSLKIIAAKNKLPAARIQATVALVDSIVKKVLAYAAADGFLKLSRYKKFTPRKGDEYWQPTPPGFISAIEPYWNTIRTFILDSCSQFNGGPPNTYNPDTSSDFYKELKEVYDIGKARDKEQSTIAMFWDCNPFALQQVGHLEFGLKKISPGGHWMGITGIVSQKKKLPLRDAVYAHTLVSVGMADAFMSSWDNKYKYNRVRPETAIKRLIDQNWNPLLQTPPFPEYTSAHSVISTTASIILTHLFGEHFSFTDDTELEFGLPARKFESFISASKEAAISRLYGGIHFRDAIENGIIEGQQIGNFVVAHSPDSRKNKNGYGQAMQKPGKN